MAPVPRFVWRLTLGVAVGLSSFWAPADSARAALVTFSFSGTVTSVGTGLSAEFGVGRPVVGLYSFESTTPDLDPADSGVYDGALRGLEFAIGTNGSSYRGTLRPNTPNSIELVRPSFHSYFVGTDQFVGRSVQGPGGATYRPGLFALNLLDPTGRALSDDRLPPLPPSLAGFLDRTLFFDFDTASGPNETVIARVDSLALVSLPPAAVLFFAGFLCLAGLHWRRIVSASAIKGLG